MVTASFTFYIEIHCVEPNSPVAVYLAQLGIPSICLNHQQEAFHEQSVCCGIFDLGPKIKVKTNIASFTLLIVAYNLGC